MSDSKETQLIRQATDIFLRLRDNPDDPELTRERDRFLAQGDAQRAAYSKMLRAWNLTAPAKKSNTSKLRSIAIAGVLVAGGYLAADPVKIALVADLSTGFETRSTALASGDHITLDAKSALIDETQGAERHVTLLQGAAFFDVETDGRPFIVASGDARIEVTGTAFEVSQLDGASVVSVTEGSVNVTVHARSWQLTAGQQLTWSKASGAQTRDVDSANTATWRSDVLLADGMTFGQIVATLDRRLPGDMVISDPKLAETRIVGTFDLNAPKASLELLAELTGASVTHVPYVLTLIRP